MWCDCAFLLPLVRGEAKTSRAPAEDRQKIGAGDRACYGHYRQPTLPRGVVLMASASVPGIYGWGNQGYALLPSALRPSSSHGGGLRVPFLFGRGVASVAAHRRPHVWTSLFFPRLIQRYFPIKSQFLERPRLLTRFSPCALRRDAPGGVRGRYPRVRAVPPAPSIK
jgi:hypothetical protein